MKYTGILLIGFIIFLVAAAGCVETETPSGTIASVSQTSTPDLTIALTTASPSGQTPGIAGGNTSAPAPDVTISPGSSLDSLDLKENYPFGNGTTWKSEATVYRIWINDTYRWFSPDDNQYYTRVAPTGKKYLFVFISMVCRGTDRAPLPQQNNIYVLYDNAIISPDPTHILPTKYPDSSPKVVRIGEIEFSKKRFDTEFVEDYGYSHGQKLGYINPGESNAVDGYVIYEVPASLKPENAYLSIVMPQSDTAIWKLG
jgi:hypothetical protein